MASYFSGAGRLVVFLCDDDRVRRSAIAAQASRDGADVVTLAADATPSKAQDQPDIGVGLVHLHSIASEPGLSAIGRITRSGIRVIAYGDRLTEWPLGVRCRALLAGATALVDAAHGDFAGQLWTRVQALAEAEAALLRDQRRVEQTFTALGIVGVSEAMRQLFRWTLRVSALSDLPTLISGESGTGKELFAQAIHRLDPKRGRGPLVVVNCAAISPALAEAELFGHRRGAFTGADHDRVGLVRAAHGGILFLDEVGELDLPLQAKLLRVLQEGRVLRVGDDQETAVDVRVIAATNRDLEGMVAQKTFRADLFHRLAVLAVHIPPLRDRRADVVPLARHFVARHQLRIGGGDVAVADDFLAALAATDLDGNVREVENIVRGALVRHGGTGPLSLADLPPEIWSRVSSDQPSASAAATAAVAAGEAAEAGYLWQVLSTNGWNLSRSLASCERALVERALQSANGNQTRAARLLGLTPRSIYNKLRKFRLPPANSA